jgi:hypothetical protein
MKTIRVGISYVVKKDSPSRPVTSRAGSIAPHAPSWQRRSTTIGRASYRWSCRSCWCGTTVQVSYGVAGCGAAGAGVDG